MHIRITVLLKSYLFCMWIKCILFLKALWKKQIDSIWIISCTYSVSTPYLPVFIQFQAVVRIAPSYSMLYCIHHIYYTITTSTTYDNLVFTVTLLQHPHNFFNTPHSYKLLLHSQCSHTFLIWRRHPIIPPPLTSFHLKSTQNSQSITFFSYLISLM